MKTFQMTIDKLGCSSGDTEYWIEEKLDGERMQMHMEEDENHPGGRRFRFWSRKAKDYTYLYGDGFEDDQSALTRHLKNGFHPNGKSISDQNPQTEQMYTKRLHFIQSKCDK